MLSNEAVRGILANRVDVQRKSVGMAVGILGAGDRQVISYGELNQEDSRTLDGNTVFEIGSLTKVFTSLLLADMVQRGEVALTDSVGNYLPPIVRVPERNGRSIRLVDLATHTSGLPLFPSDFPPFNDPAVATYSVEQLYRFLSNYELPRESGVQWEYSNTGAGLLGQALAHRAGMNYEALIRARISGPLNMNSTAMALSPQMEARLAIGHDPQLGIAPNLRMPTLAGAGGLLSSTNDLLTLLNASLGHGQSPLAPAIASMLETRRPAPQIKAQQALGWYVLGEGDDQIICHDGISLGYAATIAYDRKNRTGVVVLSNTSVTVQDIALHLLRPGLPLTKTTVGKVHTEIAVDAQLLDRYAGNYQPESGLTLVVAREGDFLVFLPPGAPKFRLHPENERDFFVNEIDLQITFETDGLSRATGMIVHYMGKDSPAVRIDGEFQAPQLPTKR